MKLATSKNNIKFGQQVRWFHKKSNTPSQHIGRIIVVQENNFIIGYTFGKNIKKLLHDFSYLEYPFAIFALEILSDEENLHQEISCKVCNKANDHDVSVCWNCGNHP